MFACSGTRLRGGGGGGGGGGDEGSGPFALWAKYLDLLDAKPLATRMVTGFAIGTFGDVLSQYTAGVSTCCVPSVSVVAELLCAFRPRF